MSSDMLEMGRNARDILRFITNNPDHWMVKDMLRKSSEGCCERLMDELNRSVAAGVALEQLGMNQAEVDGFALRYKK